MLAVNIYSRIHKYLAAVSSVLKGRCSGFENVYVYVLLKKCMPILFYGINCLNVDRAFKHTVVWNTAFRWIYGIFRIEHMRENLKTVI